MSEQLKQMQQSGKTLLIEDLKRSTNEPLLRAIQTRLCELGILDPQISGDKNTPFGPSSFADGRFGSNTYNSILAFHDYLQLPKPETQLTLPFFSRLLESTPDTFFPIQFNPKPADDEQTLLAKQILRYMQKKGYWIARAPDLLNIVYIEGADATGQPNNDRLNEWNDRRCVIRIRPGGIPEMLVNDQATTEPGRFYTLNPLNAAGAARLAFGQYKAWLLSDHKGEQPALKQVDLVRLFRDTNKDGSRNSADRIDIGRSFGINQHSTKPNVLPAQVDRYSAGCLVGLRYFYHLSFLDMLRQDRRYRGNPLYVYMTTLINGDDLARFE
jgi:peptidoglycan hydrolase-like protein with peptidoglycan-binding domain